MREGHLGGEGGDGGFYTADTILVASRKGLVFWNNYKNQFEG